MKFVRNENGEFFDVTSEFGDLESFRNGDPHSGIDLAMEIGTPIHSPISGFVDRVVDYGSNNIGKGVMVKTESGETVIFGHLSSIEVHEGEIVTIGEKIGESGNTGNVVGDGHLHMGLKDEHGNFIDPAHIEDKFQQLSQEILTFEEEEGISGFIQNIKELKGYFSEVKEEGFWKATFDMGGDTIFIHWLGETIKGTFGWIVKYNDIVFLAPAIGITFVTFLIGTNRFTKWIVPSWLAYFATTIMWYAYYL